jgi:hypothetical protein
VHIYWVFLSTIICILIVPREWEIGVNVKERYGDAKRGRWGEREMGRWGEWDIEGYLLFIITNYELYFR